MEKRFLSIGLLLPLFFLSGCIKDTITKTFTYTLWRPVYKTTASVRANIKSNAATAVRQPGKLFMRGNYIFLNEVDKGVHVIDNSNPAQPKNVAFIAIPGNVDIAVKGNTLYADLYTDLVAIDITNPEAAHVTKFVEGVFPQRAYSNGFSYYSIDSTQIIFDWIVKDTTVTEKFSAGRWVNWNNNPVFMMEDFSNGWKSFMLASSATATSSSTPISRGGSMARFTIVGERLYTVSQSNLDVFNVSNSAEPLHVSGQSVGFGIETIYPFKNRLFVGSTNGMFVYSISNADNPVQLSQFTHVQSCDPVIADDDYAFVTLRSGTACNSFTNQLEVLNVANLLQPYQVKTYAMTNPHGLSKDSNLLFICDGVDGLKVYDATQPDTLQLLTTVRGIETYDVIAYNKHALVVTKDGLYQYDYSNPAALRLLSKIALN